MIGLTGIQLYWVRNAIHLQKNELEVSVNKSLREIAQILEEEEVTAAILSDQIVNRMMTSDTLLGIRRPGRTTEQFSIRDSVIMRDGKQVLIRIVEGSSADTAGGLFTEARVIREERDSMSGKILSITPDGFHTGTLKHEQPAAQVMVNRIRLVNDLLNKIFSEQIYRKLDERIAGLSLDSLVQARLRANGVTAKYRIAVLDNLEHVISGDAELVKTASHENSYMIPLFSRDPQNNPESQGVLVLSITGENAYLLGKMWGILALSAFLLITVAVAFGFTISIIIRQKKVSQIKNDFIGNMTHELKTPISTISLACQMMNDTTVSTTDDSRRRYLTMIEDENKKLGTLVEKVLQAAILDRGQLNLKLQPVSLNELVNKAVGPFLLQASHAGGQIILGTDAASDKMNADILHLSNAIQNLLDNALKYVDTAPVIEIKTYNKLIENQEWICVMVKDNGIGIPIEHQRKIFESMYRVPTGNLHNVKGFGLGLSYTRAVILKHGGKVHLNSAPGTGSEFILEFPVLKD